MQNLTAVEHVGWTETWARCLIIEATDRKSSDFRWLSMTGCVRVCVLNVFRLMMWPFSPFLEAPCNSGDSGFYAMCDRWNCAGCGAKENSDEWSLSCPGVSFRMWVKAGDRTLNELFSCFLSIATWLQMRIWIAPNGSNWGNSKALKSSSAPRLCLMFENEIENVIATHTITQIWVNCNHRCIQWI